MIFIICYLQNIISNNSWKNSSAIVNIFKSYFLQKIKFVSCFRWSNNYYTKTRFYCKDQNDFTCPGEKQIKKKGFLK